MSDREPLIGKLRKLALGRIDEHGRFVEAEVAEPEPDLLQAKIIEAEPNPDEARVRQARKARQEARQQAGRPTSGAGAPPKALEAGEGS